MSAESARPLAENLRRLRRAAGLSVVDLAHRAGVARATLTQLESGGGNPTLETLYAFANELGVPLADLITEPDATAGTTVLRAEEGRHTSGAAVNSWLLHRERSAGISIEIYRLEIHPGAARSAAHTHGTREHLHLHSGRALVGDADEPVELGPGDYAQYPADRPHRYQRIGARPARATLVIVTPLTG